MAKSRIITLTAEVLKTMFQPCVSGVRNPPIITCIVAFIGGRGGAQFKAPGLHLALKALGDPS